MMKQSKTPDRQFSGSAGFGGEAERHPPLLAPPLRRGNLGLMRWAISIAEAQLRCPHLERMPQVMPLTYVCERCIVRGSTWTGLRLCRSCGNVGCCENSANRHADRHFRDTAHPIVDSLGLERLWSFCYLDRVRVIA